MRRFKRVVIVALLAVASTLGLGCDDNKTEWSPDTITQADLGLDMVQPEPDLTPEPDLVPPEDGIHIAGLSAAVQAVYDEHGILHLTCATDDDCFAALGYFHAANRFFVMDFGRRYVRGTLAGLVKVGDLVLQSDFLMRHFMTTADGTPLEEDAVTRLSPENLHMLQRYSAGVNAWIEDAKYGHNGAKRSTEHKFLLIDQNQDLLPWEPADTMAMALYMMNDLGNTVDIELLGAEIAAAVEPALAADLLSLRPPLQVFTTTAAGATPYSYRPETELDLSRFAKLRPLLKKAREKLQPAIQLGGILQEGRGSNNWAYGPDRTAGGHAILANDPHLSLLNPAFFMPAEVDSKSSGTGTIHVAGASLPGIPPFLIGHNEHVAWGMTVIYYDLNEVYLEQLNADGTAVMFNGQEVPFVTKTFTFPNAADKPVEKTFKWVPHHGPVIAEDPATKTAISVRWVAQDGMTDIASFMALQTATSVKELPTALSQLTATNQNFVAIDIYDNIGWFPYARIPKRPWASLSTPPWLPVPGDGSAEWEGFLEVSSLPQLINPPNGFIATANQAITNVTEDGDPTDSSDQAYQGWHKALGVRMQRIVNLIEAGGDQHSVASTLVMQKDVFSLMGEVFTPALLLSAATVDLDPATMKVVQALQTWTYTCPTGLASSDPEGAKESDPVQARESIGCTAFHAALYALLDAAFDDEEAAAGIDFPQSTQFKVLLKDLLDPADLQTASSFWDDLSTSVVVETRDDAMLKALMAAGVLLTGWQDEPDDWRWGRLHTLTFRSIYASFGIPAFNFGNFANDGALYTVDAASPRGDGLDMSQRHGATLRLVAEADPAGIKMKFQLAGGTDLHRDSPFYNQFVDRYLKNEPIDFPFGPGAVTTPAETIEVLPLEE